MRLGNEFYDLLKGLLRAPSVVGAEHSFFTTLKRELDERGARVTWYDGALVAQGASPSSMIFSAHVDRHGLICTGPNEFQYAAFVAGRRSDLLGNSVSEKLMTKVVDRFSSARVFAYDPWSGAYLGFGEIQRAYVCDRRKNLIFEISNLQHLAPGTPIAFTDRVTIQDGKITGQLDNALTVAHLAHLFDHGFKGTVLFTAQEESGSSWRYMMEWFRRFSDSVDNLIVVDTSPFFVSEDSEMPDVVLRLRDANAEFNPKMAERLETICREQGLSYVFKDRYIEDINRQEIAAGRDPQSLGSTELGRIVAASNGAIQGTTLQIPTTGYHTVNETATIRSNESFAGILRTLAGLS